MPPPPPSSFRPPLLIIIAQSLNLFEPHVTYGSFVIAVIHKYGWYPGEIHWMIIFCKNSHRTRDIRNALVRRAYFSWPHRLTFAFPLFIPCDRSWDQNCSRSAGWCASGSASERYWLLFPDDVATLKGKGSIRSMAGTDLCICLNCTCIHTVLYVCW